ncbi:fibrous sheath-interacting protein 1 [Microcaecilia unicolor]|uniref:Fibrous sheath-interacting protein 1 n=1 Tax=Microcaecilia unicolor TaxID=1415580 RepID=A0A6P7XZK5_9AMPH|nr:fibrous sheath-interacting protein 1 [Microcaecilia unicolor]
MDIVRSSLDEISRPACSGKSRPGSRVSPCSDKAKTGIVSMAAGSLEVLPPEPKTPEAGAELAPSPTPDAWGGSWTPERENRDPRLQQAVRTMRRLDKILARKQAREREVKAQGLELSRKLWEELRASVLPGSSPSPEEAANTGHFLVLTKSAQQEDLVAFTPVFQTQVPSDEDGDGEQSQQMGRKRKGARGKKKTEFIKRNVELVKEAGDQVMILLEEEKDRLLELLKDMDEGISDTPGTEEDVCERIVAGEGYTPEPREHQQLVKIDAELQAVLSVEDFSALRSSYSSIPSQIYQQSVVYINGNQETAPGERVLRDNREQREQQNRLKEIDHQLRTMDFLSDRSASLSEEQLRSLLQDCLCSQRSSSAATEEEALDSDRTTSSCCSAKDFPPLSKTALAKLLDNARNLGITAPDVTEEDERSENEMVGYYLSKALASSQEPKLNDECENNEEEMNDSITEDYFMSETSGRRSLKRSPHLEPYYDSDNTHPLIKASISGLAEGTCGDELRIEDVTED